MKKKDLQQPNTARQAPNEKDDQRLQNGSLVPKPKYIAYPHALRILEQRDVTKYDLIAAVVHGPEFGGLHAYYALTPYEDPLIFSFANYATRDVNQDFDDYISLVMNCKFLAEDIENFCPVERYISGHELIERWRKLLGMEPRHYIAAKIMESELIAFHPVYGLTEPSNSAQGPQPPLATGIFALSGIIAIEELELGAEKVKPSSDLNHDLKMQKKANEMAAHIVAHQGRKPTKGEVAKKLPTELDIKPETVERRIRKQW